MARRELTDGSDVRHRVIDGLQELHFHLLDHLDYYSYTSPEPDGLRDQPLSAGEWIEFGSGSLAILPYETVRTARDPRQGLLAFLQSAYEAGARLAGWDAPSFESNWCPSPTQLQELHVSAAATLGRTTEKE